MNGAGQSKPLTDANRPTASHASNMRNLYQEEPEMTEEIEYQAARELANCMLGIAMAVEEFEALMVRVCH